MESTQTQQSRLFGGYRAYFWIALAVLVVQAAGIGNGFVYDDDFVLHENPVVTEGRVSEVFGTDIWGNHGIPNSGTYRPLMTLSFLLQWRILPNAAWFFHLTNGLLLVLAGWLAFIFFRRFEPFPVPFLAALLFVLHPVNAEVTFNIVQRSALLSGVFSLGFLCLLAPGERLSPRRILGGGLLFFLALLSKEDALAAPVVLVLAWRFAPGVEMDIRQVFTKLGRLLLLCFLAFGLYTLLRWNALGGFSREVPYLFNPTVNFPAIYRHLNTGWLLLAYFRRFLVPFPQPMEWTYDQLPVFGPGHEVFLALVWLALLAVAIPALWALRQRRTAAFGLAWFVVWLLPVTQAFVTVTVIFADRCLFLPGAGLSLAIVATARMILERFGKNGRPLWGLLLPILAISFVYQARIAPRYKDNPTLFSHLAENSPRAANALHGYGKFLYAQGRYLESSVVLSRAFDIGHLEPDILQWLGKALLAAGEPGAALDAWDRLPAMTKPAFIEKFRQEQGELMRHFAAQWTPDRAEEALILYKRLASLDPKDFGSAAGWTLCAAFLDREDWKEVARAWLKHFPGHPKQAEILRVLADFRYRFVAGSRREPLKDAVRTSFPYRVVEIVTRAELGLYAAALEKLRILERDYPDNSELRALEERVRKAGKEEETQESQGKPAHSTLENSKGASP